MLIPIELKIFRTSLLAAAIATFLLMLNDFYNDKFMMSVVEIPGIILFVTAYWLTYKLKNTQILSLVAALLAFSLLAVAIIINRGFGVGLATIYIATCVMAQVIVHPRYSAGVAIFSISVFTLLLLLEFYHPEFTNTAYFDPTFATPKTTIVILFYISIFFVTWICRALKIEYFKTYEHLMQKQDEISAMNQNLDELVNERTASLHAEKEKILEFAFLNSHSTRAPLSNILMLHEVLDIEQLNQNQKSDIISKLKKEAQTLDTNIKAMQDKLQSESIKDHQ